jgi:hypothetical protein
MSGGLLPLPSPLGHRVLGGSIFILYKFFLHRFAAGRIVTDNKDLFLPFQGKTEQPDSWKTIYRVCHRK